MRRTSLLAPLAAALALVAAVPAPTASGPVEDTENAVRAHGRLADQYGSPAFLAALGVETLETYPRGLLDQARNPDRPMMTAAQTVPGGSTTDPFRQRWEEQGRGVQVAVEWENRVGARIQGHVWAPRLPFTDPVTGRTTSGPLPGVVITTGSIQGYEEMYLWAAQGLAEAGYLVLTYDVQGQGHSETFGHRPDGSLWCGTDGCPGVPFQQAANFFEGTEDALDFFVSPANPLRGLLDERRLGLAGHSLGASAVTAVGNREVPVPSRPDIEIDAVVGWDNISLPQTDPVSRVPLAPRVPTMGQNAEFFFTPTPFPPSNRDAGTATFERFRAAGVPSHQVALRSSTHLEWTYVPLILPASSEGERVAMHYTLAWFDRWLKGGSETLPASERLAQAADARRRLTATTFDGSADRSAIGAGRFDPATGGNVPHTIAGEPRAAHLSRYLRSAYAFDGLDCRDLLAGC